MAKVIDSQYIKLLQSVSLNLSANAKNNRLGKRRSLSKGTSVEFSDYREYIAGDDYRRIDWNALARFEKLFVKLYVEEQESPLTILFDASNSMGTQDKRVAAIKTAALFAYTSLREYDSVNVAIFNDAVIREIRNLHSAKSFYHFSEALETLNFDGKSNLYGALRSLYRTRKKGYTIIVSDLLYDSKLDEVFDMLAFKKQHTIVCHILSDDDINPHYDKHVRLKDIETREEIDVDINDRVMDIYQKNFKDYIDGIKNTCLKHAVDYFLINSSDDIENFIYHLAKSNIGRS